MRQFWLSPAAVSAVLTMLAAASGGAQIPVSINIQTQTAVPLAAGFSGFNTPQPRNGVEYFDPKFIAAVTPLKPGWVRYPGGTVSLAFDWSTGHINTSWMHFLTGNPPLVAPQTTSILTLAQLLTQAKGGVKLSDFATFAGTLGASAIICFNTFTDNHADSALRMALAARSYGLSVAEWELGNEAYLYPKIFPTAASYASALEFLFHRHKDRGSVWLGWFVSGGFISGRAGHLCDLGQWTFIPHFPGIHSPLLECVFESHLSDHHDAVRAGHDVGAERHPGTRQFRLCPFLFDPHGGPEHANLHYGDELLHAAEQPVFELFVQRRFPGRIHRAAVRRAER